MSVHWLHLAWDPNCASSAGKLGTSPPKSTGVNLQRTPLSHTLEAHHTAKSTFFCFACFTCTRTCTLLSTLVPLHVYRYHMVLQYVVHCTRRRSYHGTRVRTRVHVYRIRLLLLGGFKCSLITFIIVLLVVFGRRKRGLLVC